MVADVVFPNRRGLVVGIMLLLATVFFVWGSFAERSGHHDAHASVPSGEAAANGESAAHRAAEGGGLEGAGSAVVATESAVDLFDAWRAALPPPLSPMVMRGRPINVVDRARAGLPPEFIDALELWLPS